jgi:hypothetical protein
MICYKCNNTGVIQQGYAYAGSKCDICLCPQVFQFGNGPAKYVYASAFDQMKHEKEQLERELQEARDLLKIVIYPRLNGFKGDYNELKNMITEFLEKGEE